VLVLPTHFFVKGFEMAQFSEISKSRFSNWSQHLDFSLFRPFARPDPIREKIDINIGNGDQSSWDKAKENPTNWPKTRKGIHLVVPGLYMLDLFLQTLAEWLQLYFLFFGIGNSNLSAL
jgi:hypothetical protein